MYLSKLLFLIIVLLLPLSSLSSSFEVIEALNSNLDAQRPPSYVQELAAKAVLERLLPTHLSSFEFKIVPKVQGRGRAIFWIDVAQKTNDTEESIWCFLCEAQLYGVDEARKQFLEVGRDPRPVMWEAYNMFKDGGDPEKLVAAFSSGRENEYFYASLYAGLYYECQSKPDGAKLHIVNACQSPYGLRSDDYMASLAKVHAQCRNWSSS